MTIVPRWITHANVNTADVARSERFYTEVLGLVPQARTAPSEPQDGSGFAMPDQAVQWRGVILGDHRAPRGAVVDLLEWLAPPTTGAPASEPNRLGHVALRFGVADVEAVVGRATEHGSAITRLHHDDPAGARDVVIVRDPDGTRIELEQLDDPDGSPHYRGVRVNCADIDRSLAFFTQGFGLEAEAPRTVSVSDADGGPGSRESGRLRVASVSVPGQADRFSLELTQWEDPVATGRPPTTGNHAGIYRVAAVVHDIAASHARVLDVLPTAVAPVEVTVFDDQPPLLASFYPDPDGAIFELIEPAVPGPAR